MPASSADCHRSGFYLPQDSAVMHRKHAAGLHPTEEMFHVSLGISDNWNTSGGNLQAGVNGWQDEAASWWL